MQAQSLHVISFSSPQCMRSLACLQRVSVLFFSYTLAKICVLVSREVSGLPCPLAPQKSMVVTVLTNQS